MRSQVLLSAPILQLVEMHAHALRAERFLQGGNVQSREVAAQRRGGSGSLAGDGADRNDARDVPQIICRRKAATGSQKIGDGRVIQRAERKLVDRTAFGPVGEHADAAFASPVIVARANVGLRE